MLEFMGLGFLWIAAYMIVALPLGRLIKCRNHTVADICIVVPSGLIATVAMYVTWLLVIHPETRYQW